MRQSKLFYKTSKEAPKEAEIASHKLLVKADFISQLASGIYSFLPLGYNVHKKISDIIRDELDAIGSQELFLPVLQPKELWLKTGRWEKMDPPIIVIKDRHDREFALGPTHEEVITDLAKPRIQSYKDLPVALYQIQTKFRNEMRLTGGLLRTKEFAMADLYSFHWDKEDLEKFFNRVLGAYDNIFHRCGLDAVKSEASGGAFTKEKTYEFQVISDVGEDKILFCPKCKWAANLEVAQPDIQKKCPQCGAELTQKSSIEVGHTFRLGTKYSEPLSLSFVNEKGEKKNVIMGCYGIGVGRLMATIVEINRDNNGIVWPEEVAPFRVHLIQIENSKKVKDAAEKLHFDLQKENIEVLYDDREDKTTGEKFAEADLLGMPYRIVVSERTVEKKKFEVKKRKDAKAELMAEGSLMKILKPKQK